MDYPEFIISNLESEKEESISIQRVKASDITTSDIMLSIIDLLTSC